LYFNDHSNEIYGKLGLYDENGENGTHFDIKEDLNTEWKKDYGNNVYYKFKEIVEIKDFFISI
jgi:hypothetical protein